MKVSAWFLLALGAVYVFGLTVLGVSLFRLQCLDAGTFTEDQAKQTIRTVRVPGLRGRILDRHGVVLAECRASHGIQCHPEEFDRFRKGRKGAGETNTVRAIEAAAGRLAAIVGSPCAVTFEQMLRHLRTASAMPLALWTDLDDAALARFAERADEFPGFSDFTQAERTYPLGALAAHVLGYTGRGRPDDADTAHYFETDLFGRDGVESHFNTYLTGVTGVRKVTVDARGFRPVAGAGAPSNDVAPNNGLDLRLTIDVEIQRVLEEQLEGLTGAGVVLDPRDGAVLAMASAPTFDPNTCVPRLSAAVYAALTNAPAKRAQNRAISESYAPGSTFKPITALAALSCGWLADDEYDCRGVYVLGNLRLHCWDRYGHGHLGLREALEKSCNSYFCNLGTAVGSNAVITAARAFGLGARTGIDLGGETPGVVPDDGWKRAAFDEPWFPGDTCQMSIGQGMLLVTPLQMAVVCAALANGGAVHTPYLHAREAGQSAPRAARRLPFPAEDIELVRLGMRDVAEKGTGRRILTRWADLDKRRRYNLAVPCAGKTGTAEIGRGATKRKNTWVIAFAPYDTPTAAIAMVVERGESGGTTVAPRVHAVFAKMFGEVETTGGRAAAPGRSD